MFAFDATPVRFVGLLVLFVWCTVWCSYELTRPQDVRQRVSNALHLGMALVMLAMVAPWSWQALVRVVPTPLLVALFGLGTAWFGWLAIGAVRNPGRRGATHVAGHAAMFGAMTWHLGAMAAMGVAMAEPHDDPGMGSGMSNGGDMGDMGGLSHPMDMGQWMAEQSRPGGLLWLFALVGLPLMVYLLVAGINAVRRAFRPRVAMIDPCPCGPDCTCGPECACQPGHPAAPVRELALIGAGASSANAAPTVPAAVNHSCHELRPIGSAKYRLSALSDAAMNLGMFWMSTGLLVPILPFFALLAF